MASSQGPEPRQTETSRWRSVRVRLTLAATLATALTITAGAYALVRTVEHTLFDRIESRTRDRVEKVAQLLAKGVPPAELPLGDMGPFQVIQVYDDQGRLQAGAPALFVGVGSGGPGGSATAGSVGAGVSAPSGPDDRGGLTRSPATGDRVFVTNKGDLVTVASEAVQSPHGDFQVKVTSPLGDARRSVDTLANALTFSLPIFIGLVGLTAWIVTGRALRPVEAIRQQVESISASTIHRRVPEPKTGDEISRLARTMNAMLDRLHQATLRQRQFVSDASHELRSPVAAIRTEMEVALRTDEQGHGNWRQAARNVLTEEARMEALVGDLLLLAALDEAEPEPVPDVLIDLAGVVRSEAERPRKGDAESVDAAVEVDVDVELDAGVPSQRLLVRGDRLQLSRVVGNVIENATRNARSTVRVSVAHRGTDVRVLVDDDGLGIPVADRERVFERFTRLEEARSRDGGGAGLGLAMVRAIVGRHDGRVFVDDAPLGGARFVIDLPAAADTA